MIKVGDRVKIVKGIDDEFDSKHLNKIGKVSSIVPYCGDDFYTVVFDEGGVDGFWLEELEKVS